MRIIVNIYQTNKKVVCYCSTKNACKSEFEYHLWLPFIDQTQSDIVVFNNYLSGYKILV